jgi:hypothetical protein
MRFGVREGWVGRVETGMVRWKGQLSENGVDLVRCHRMHLNKLGQSKIGKATPRQVQVALARGLC